MEVVAVELVGAESYVHGVADDGSAIVFRVSGRSIIAIGETLDLIADRERFHLFDQQASGFTTTSVSGSIHAVFKVKAVRNAPSAFSASPLA